METSYGDAAANNLGLAQVWEMVQQKHTQQIKNVRLKPLALFTCRTDSCAKLGFHPCLLQQKPTRLKGCVMDFLLNRGLDFP